MPSTKKSAAAVGAKPSAMSSADVKAAMLAKAQTSCLGRDDVTRLKLKPYTAAESVALGLPASKAGFLIPYFALDGKPLKFFRYRYLEDTRTGFQAQTGRKPLRYAQPLHSPVEVYLPPNIDWPAVAADPSQRVVFTEGELKAASGCRAGFATMGLGGVWSFQNKYEAEPLLPLFDEFDWTERQVVICYDSDGATNPDVVAAENRLAKRLTERGAYVYIARIPVPEGEGAPKKLGMDDYMFLHGAEEFEAQVLNAAYVFDECKALHEMNELVIYVRNPGLVWEHLGRQRMAPGAFKEHHYADKHHWENRPSKTDPKGTLVKVATAKAWLEWPHRAVVPSMSFAPGDERITKDGKLNTWTGWGLKEPIFESKVDQWHRLMKHLFGDATCTLDNGKVVKAVHYFTQWCAYPLIHPGAKMHVACAIWGPTHGTGKTLVGETLMRIYGDRHSAELKDSNLDDERNEWAENQQFVLADDISSRGDRKFMRRLMTMVTQKWLRMNPKYVPSYSIEDVINYYFTSNDPDALFMDDQDRRFFVHEVTAGKFDYHEYVKWMKSEEGPAALWGYLLQYDMEGFDPWEPAPTTIGKQNMIEVGKSELGAWVADFKANTDGILAKAKLEGDIFSVAQLHFLYDPNGDKKTTANAVSRELKRAGFNKPSTGNNLRLSDGRQLSTYAVRNQAHWAKASWKEACEHYEKHNPPVRPAGKKF